MKSPIEITESLYIKAIDFLERSRKEIFAGGILAGVFVSLAAITSITVCSGMSIYFGAGFTKLIFGIVFTLGMILLVFSGSELFTGSHMHIAPIYDDKSYIKRLLSNWGLIFLANAIGSIIMINFILATGVLDNENISLYLIKIAGDKLDLPIWQAFIRGILCNFLVCLAVRVGEASDHASGKIIGYVYVIGAFVINSFEHSVANMFLVPIGIILGANQGIHFSWQTFIFKNLLPVTIGNVIGGALFVSTAYYFMHRKYFYKKLNARGSENVRSDDSGNFTA